MSINIQASGGQPAEKPKDNTPTAADLKAAWDADKKAESIPQLPDAGKSKEQTTADAAEKAEFLKAVHSLAGFNKDTKFTLNPIKNDKDEITGVKVNLAHGIDSGEEGKVNADISLNLNATGKILEKLKEALNDAPKTLDDLLKLIAPKVEESFGSKKEAITASKMQEVFSKIMSNFPTPEQLLERFKGVELSPEKILNFLSNAFNAVQAPKSDSK
jgi:hypothetical protein